MKVDECPSSRLSVGGDTNESAHKAFESLRNEQKQLKREVLFWLPIH
jgi:hypothetical protein